jgi:hypothetical protein
LSVTGKGQLSQRASFLVLFSIVAILLLVMALLRPTTVFAQDDVNDHPALNIAKENEAGDRLAGAVFVVEGSDEQFTTGENGKVCITELNGQFLEDRPYLVTEVTPPQGYALPSEPSQMVEPDNDGSGHCDSPDAVFVDPRESELGGNPTPSPTPRESELGGNPTPAPGGEVPDTATTGLGDQVPALVLSLVLVGSLATLFYVRIAGHRR